MDERVCGTGPHRHASTADSGDAHLGVPAVLPSSSTPRIRNEHAATAAGTSASRQLWTRRFDRHGKQRPTQSECCDEAPGAQVAVDGRADVPPVGRVKCQSRRDPPLHPNRIRSARGESSHAARP